MPDSKPTCFKCGEQYTPDVNSDSGSTCPACERIADEAGKILSSERPKSIEVAFKSEKEINLDYPDDWLGMTTNVSDEIPANVVKMLSKDMGSYESTYGAMMQIELRKAREAVPFWAQAVMLNLFLLALLLATLLLTAG